jgi:hypothetical protein
MPASTLHPITDVAKPVSDCAAVRAQAGDCAVMMARAARMSKASANVSTTRTPLCSLIDGRSSLIQPVIVLRSSGLTIARLGVDNVGTA